MINIIIAEKGYNFRLVEHKDLTTTFIHNQYDTAYKLEIESEINDDDLYTCKGMILTKSFPCKYGTEREFIMSSSVPNFDRLIEILTENLKDLR